MPGWAWYGTKTTQKYNHNHQPWPCFTQPIPSYHWKEIITPCCRLFARHSHLIVTFFFVSQQTHRCVETWKKTQTAHDWNCCQNLETLFNRKYPVGAAKSKSPQRAKTRNYWNQQPVLSGFPQSKNSIIARFNHNLYSQQNMMFSDIYPWHMICIYYIDRLLQSCCVYIRVCLKMG